MVVGDRLTLKGLLDGPYRFGLLLGQEQGLALLRQGHGCHLELEELLFPPGLFIGRTRAD
jgi:hypothetical protein